MHNFLKTNYKIFIWPALVFGFHLIATFFGWYWSILWLDVPMHLLGGASIALSTYFWLRRFNQPEWLLGLSMISITALVAVGWEDFELVIDTVYGTHTQLGIYDALKDLYNGIVGATIITAIGFLKRRNRS